MARPLRVEQPGGRYHVTSRGNERKPIYRDGSDRARKRGRYSLRESGELAGGADYVAVGQAVRGFDRRLTGEPQLRRTMTPVENELSNVEM